MAQKCNKRSLSINYRAERRGHTPMAYSIHIERIEAGTLHKRIPITLDEWLAYVSSDAEMHFRGETSITSPSGQVITLKNAGLTEWIEPQRGNKAWFTHSPRGSIAIARPSTEALAKALCVARALGATVRGDGDERYDM